MCVIARMPEEADQRQDTTQDKVQAASCTWLWPLDQDTQPSTVGLPYMHAKLHAIILAAQGTGRGLRTNARSQPSPMGKSCCRWLVRHAMACSQMQPHLQEAPCTVEDLGPTGLSSQPALVGSPLAVRNVTSMQGPAKTPVDTVTGPRAQPYSGFATLPLRRRTGMQ